MLKNGRVLASGPTEDVLTPERVRALYDVDVDVIRHGASGFADRARSRLGREARP